MFTKSLVVLTIIAGLVGVNGEPKPGEDRKAFLARIVGECSQEFRIELEKANKLLAGDLTINSSDAKCFVSCFFKKEGFLSEDGKPKREFIVDFLDGTVPFKRPDLEKVVNMCTDFKSEDDCQNSFKLLECFTNALAAKAAADEL